MKFKRFLSFFIAPVLVLLIHIFLLFFTSFYDMFPWFDVPMHFIGGMAIGWSFILILNYAQRKNYAKFNKSVFFVFVISLVALIAIFWEFFEFGLEMITGMNFQGNLNDTLIDLFMGLFGGGFISFVKVYLLSK